MIAIMGVCTQSVMTAQTTYYTIYAGDRPIICMYPAPVTALPQGAPVVVEGEWAEEPDKGQVLVISKIELSDDPKSQIEWIKSLLHARQGDGDAQAVYDAVLANGTRFFIPIFNFWPNFALFPPQVLEGKLKYCKVAIKHLTEANMALKAWEISVSLHDCGVSRLMATRLASEYNAMQEIKDNPYMYARRSYGYIPMEVADAIAEKYNCEIGPYAADSEKDRICCLVEATQDRFGSRGDVFTPAGEFLRAYKQIAYRYGESRPFALIAGLATSCIRYDHVGGELVMVHLEAQKAEQAIAETVKARARAAKPIDITFSDVIRAEESCGLTLSDDQREAVCALLSDSRVSVLTGGPGTGKTTVLRVLLAAYKAKYPAAKICICAPTGRAAQRAVEVTGVEAATIHRTIGWSPFEGAAITYNYSNPLPADLVVIDESSMLDSMLGQKLFDAVKPSAKIILIGDSAQLPSVQPGALLRDLLCANPNYVIQTKLTTVHRQADGAGGIIGNAARVINGIQMLAPGKDFVIERVSNSEGLPLMLDAKLGRKKPSKKELLNVQILTSTKQGDGGTHTLNRLLQSKWNPERERQGKIDRLRTGDKVMAQINNADAGYYNGDLGTLNAVGDYKIKLQLLSGALEVPKTSSRDFDLAYACTIHKSQGSEFDTVYIILPQKPGNMLNRNLLYTAITRAKRKVVVISEGDALEKAIRRCSPERRTFLGGYLNE